MTSIGKTVKEGSEGFGRQYIREGSLERHFYLHFLHDILWTSPLPGIHQRGSGATSAMATIQPWDKSSSFWLEKWSVLLSPAPASHFSLHPWGLDCSQRRGFGIQAPKGVKQRLGAHQTQLFSAQSSQTHAKILLIQRRLSPNPHPSSSD